MNSNFDKYPSTQINGFLIEGWQGIIKQIAGKKESKHIAFDCYPGVHHEEIKDALSRTGIRLVDTTSLMKPKEEITALTHRYMTDDVLFGYITTLRMADYFDLSKVASFREEVISSGGQIILYGHGAHYVLPDADLLLFADMARWEIIQRFRRGEVNGIGVENRHESPSIQYKRGYFNDWRIYDVYKRHLMNKVDYWIDTHIKDHPKMIDANTFKTGLAKTVKRPFRVVPFFDAAPWGGQWMKGVCGLDPKQVNYGWCFDCVPEENSLLLNVNGVIFEMPSVNLVLSHTPFIQGV